MIVVKNVSKNTVLSDKTRVADTFFTRLKGLLGSPPLQSGEGLLLKHEKSVHTFFMGFTIDVVYIDRDYTVIKIDPDMVPSKVGAYVSQSTYILELPAGKTTEASTTVGDKLIFDPMLS